MTQKNLLHTDVLELDVDVASDSSFSGFSEPEESTSKLQSTVHVVKPKKSSKLKVSKSSDRTKARKTSSDSQNKPKKSSDGQHKSAFDISKLSENDLESLRTALGIQDSRADAVPSHDYYFQEDMVDYEPLTIEIDAKDVDGGEGNPQQIDFQAAMFGQEDCNNNIVSSDDVLWDLPKLKAPEFGNPVSKSLADLINLACSKQCDTDSIVKQYKVPSNCELATPPLVNQQIWKTLDKNAHRNDKTMVDIQNLVAVGFAPVIKLADLLKGQLSAEAKTLLSDLMTILGQIQYNLSVRRRYLIRPCLRKRYQTICNMTTPMTHFLFGDNIDKDIQNCENSSIGREYRGGFTPMRSRGRPMRRGYNSYTAGYYERYQPYPQRGQSIARGFRPRRRPQATATATAPNERPE